MDNLTPEDNWGLTLQAPTPEPQDNLTLIPPGVPSPVRGSVAAERAKKFDMALGDLSPGTEALEHGIKIGDETRIRQNAAISVEARQRDEQTRRLISQATSGQFDPNIAYQAYLEYTQPIKVNPDTVIEETFGQNYLKTIFGINNAIAQIRQRAMEEDPVATMAALDGTQRLIARQQIAIKNLEDAEAASGNWLDGSHLFRAAGPLGNVLANVNVPKLVNTLGTMLPVVSAANISGPGGEWGDLAQPSQALQRAIMTYYSFKDLGEAAAWLKEETARIGRWNPEDAVKFARAIVNYNLNEAFLDDLIGVTDVTPVGTLTAGAKVAGNVFALRRLLRNSVDGLADGGLKMENVYVAVGDMDKAADVLLAKKAFKNRDPLGLAGAIDELPWSHHPNIMIERNPGSLANDLARKMTMILTDQWTKMLDDATKSTRVQRVPRDIHDTLLDNTKGRIEAEFPSVNDTVINHRLFYEPLNGSYYGETMVADLDGTFFKSIAAAQRRAEDMGLGHLEYKIVSDPNFIAINSTGMAGVRALDPIKEANKIPGFSSIQGTVRLKDGTEIKVSNRKDGIYRQDNKEQVLPSDVDAYKNSAKGSTWKTVPSEIAQKTSAIFKKNSIKQMGTGYYISIVRSADETDPLVRGALLTLENTNPVSLWNYLAGGLVRTAEDQVAYFQRGNRHIATHSPNAVLERIAEVAKTIGRMDKDSFEALDLILKRNRDHSEEINGELIRGRAYQSQAVLEREWMDAHKRLPTEQESLAYWTYHQLMDLDWVLRNLGVHRDLARVGVSERYTVRMGVDENEVSFPGKFVAELPKKMNGNPGILVIDEGKPVDYVRFQDMGKEGKLAKKDIEELLANGYRIIQVANPVDRPFKKQTGSGQTVNYVITKNSSSEPLPMNLVDRNPGVHIQYPHEWYIKQPIVEVGEGGRNIYYGDRTILAADTEAGAKRLYKALDQLRIKLRDDPEGLNRLSTELFIHKNLPKNYDFWWEKFYGENRFLDVNIPIRHVHSGDQVVGRHRDLIDNNPLFKDLVNERNTEFNLMRNIDMDFMADRDGPLMQVVNKGSTDKPVWDMEKARVLDPTVSLNRALANSVRSQFMNDYKISAIEQWARQYGKYLTQPHVAESNPFQAFYHGELVKSAEDMQELVSARNVRARILNFVGTQSELGRDLNLFNAKVMNMTEKLAGEKAVRYYNDHELRFAKDPVAFLRSMLFHAKFGIPGNIKQFIIQAQGYVSTLGIMTGAHGPIQGPKMTSMAMAAYAFQRGVDLTDYANITNHIANKVAAWGWNKNHYLEAARWMKDDGWRIVGNEHAYRDSFDPDLFKRGKNTFLAIGTAPFYEGERATRMIAGFASYLEWRKANPTAKFDDFAKAAVLTRADDLSGNMTRASHSALQEGIFRFPTQFYTFSQRIMEQYWSGKRFTPKEKFGLFATQSVFYGVPAAIGATTFAIPVYDMIRSQVLDDGRIGVGPVKTPPIDVNNKWFQAVTEGWQQYLLFHLTGKQYDIQGRYGPGPSDQLAQILDGEKDWFEVLGGASGTFVRDLFLGTLTPVKRMLHTAVAGGDINYRPTWNDVEPLLRQMSVYSDYKNAWVAFNTGKYFSKNGREVADGLDKTDAIAMIFGLQRREIKDAYLNLGTLKDQEEHQKAAMGHAVNEYRLALQYLRDREYNKADVHFMRAQAHMVPFGDLTDRQIRQVRERVETEYSTLIQEVDKQMLERGFQSRLPARLRRVLEQ